MKPIVCVYCGVELSWKEIIRKICFTCDRDREDKANKPTLDDQ